MENHAKEMVKILKDNKSDNFELQGFMHILFGGEEFITRRDFFDNIQRTSCTWIFNVECRRSNGYWTQL